MTISSVRVEAASWDVDNNDCEEELKNLFQRYQDMLSWNWYHGTYGLFLISRVSAEAYIPFREIKVELPSACRTPLPSLPNGPRCGLRLLLSTLISLLSMK
jgi:hypothetical protein